MALFTAFKHPGPNGFGSSSTASDVCAGLDLTGLTFLVTGANSGLGLETLRAVAARGGTIVAVARTLEKAKAALGSDLGTAVASDLSEPASVRECVAQVKALGRSLDAIVCNAGVMALPKLEVKYGLELQFLTNHVGHFILVTGLLDMLAANGRVVVTSSEAHRGGPRAGIDFDNLDGSRGYRSWSAYSRSKLANLLFALELAKRFAGTARTANAVHPGVISTNLWQHIDPISRAAMGLLAPLFLKTAAQGAATQTGSSANKKRCILRRIDR